MDNFEKVKCNNYNSFREEICGVSFNRYDLYKHCNGRYNPQAENYMILLSDHPMMQYYCWSEHIVISSAEVQRNAESSKYLQIFADIYISVRVQYHIRSKSGCKYRHRMSDQRYTWKDNLPCRLHNMFHHNFRCPAYSNARSSLMRSFPHRFSGKRSPIIPVRM